KDNLPPELQVEEITVDGVVITGNLQQGINIGTIDTTISRVIEIAINVVGSFNEIYKNIVNAVATAIIEPTKPPVTVTATATDSIGVKIFNPKLILTKSADKTYAIVGETVTYKIVAKNTGDITLGNLENTPVTIYDKLNTSLQFVVGSVKVNGVPDISSDILSGVVIGELSPGESIVVTFQAIIISANINPITNTSNSSYGYEVPGLPPEVGVAKSNPVSIVPEVANIDVIKTADKDLVVLGGTITYTVILKNTGTTDALNVIFKDELPNEVEIINGSFSVNGEVVNIVNIRKGINIGDIKVGKEEIIKYTVKIIKSTCNLKIVNSAKVNFIYSLPNGNAGTTTSKDTTNSSEVVNIGISNFKQISVNKQLKIQMGNPDIEEVADVTGNITISKYNIIKTPILISNEGQNLTGYKLIIYGIINEIVEYTAKSCVESLHSSEYYIPFSTFIVLPVDYCFANIEVKGVIEDIYFKKLYCRTLFTDATILIKAIVCSS
ncbi:MAG: DUF7507 domain-containing protein, partial [Clostridium sp.]